MKKAPIYLLLFLYTAVQLKPLTAVVQDVMAHTFFSMQHMATVHYENGRYHLHKDLKAIHEQDTTAKTGQKPASEKPGPELSPQIIQEQSFYSAHSLQTASHIFFHPLQDVLSGFTQITSPPPKA